MGRKNPHFIGAYVRKDTKRALQRLAKLQDRSMNWLIEKILEEGVKHLETKNGKALAE